MQQMNSPTGLPILRGPACAMRSRALIRVAFGRFRLAAARYRQRRHLKELDARLLADIGLTRREVERECAKPFWQV